MSTSAEELEKMNIDLYALENQDNIEYYIYPEKPYQIKTHITNDFLKIAEKYSKNEKEKKELN